MLYPEPEKVRLTKENKNVIIGIKMKERER